MTLEEIKSELAGMRLEDQNHLAAYLVHLRHLRDPQVLRDMTDKNADRSADKWISVDDLRKKWSD